MSSLFYLTIIGISLSMALVGFIYKSKATLKPFYFILVTLILVMLMESLGKYTAQRGINNSLLYNMGWVYLESALLIGYFLSFEKNEKTKHILTLISIALFSWGATNTLLIQNITNTFQFYSFGPLALYLIFLAIRFLSQLLRLQIYPNHNLLRLPYFWIAITILFFYAEALLLFGTYQYFPEYVIRNVEPLFSLNRLLAGIMYATFGLSFFWTSKFYKVTPTT